MRLIDADALRETMYHEAFETDTDMQKWDSGCWIRYKMFENALEDAPTIDAEPVVRCCDCEYLQCNMRQDEEDLISCENCGKVIKGYGRMSASEVLSIAQKKYGGCYCADCMTKSAK